jgi:hypothetical protein
MVKSPNNTSKWQMGFNSVFKGLIVHHVNRMKKQGQLVSIIIEDNHDTFVTKGVINVHRSSCSVRYVCRNLTEPQFSRHILVRWP